MKNRNLKSLAALSALTALSAFAPLSAAPANDLALVRVESSLEIKAAPADVWKALVSTEGQSAISGGFKPDQGAGVLKKVGQAQHGSCQGDQGNIVVTHVEDKKEIRLAFDPDNGAYVCRSRIVLAPAAGGTRITFQDWYSEDKPEMIEKNRTETQQGLQQGLEALRDFVEKKKR